VLAADDNVVAHNVVMGNDTFGIAVANFCVAQAIDPDTCALLGIEPNADDARVVFNVVLGTGTNPDPRLLNPVFAVDLAWDTTGSDNCWSFDQFRHVVPGGPAELLLSRGLASWGAFRYGAPTMAQATDPMLLATLRDRVRALDERVAALGRHL
jgi:hypothetical protein